MANTARWIGGVSPGLTWASLGVSIIANLNSLANGSCASTGAQNNASNLDLYLDFSFSCHPGATTTATSYFTTYLLPQNQDGTSYGDGSIGVTTTFAGSPDPSFIVATHRLSSPVTTAGFCVGIARGILLPPGSYLLVLQNNTGNALNASAGASVKMRTYSENLNG